MHMRESSSTEEKINELTNTLEINADIMSTLVHLYSAPSLELRYSHKIFHGMRKLTSSFRE